MRILCFLTILLSTAALAETAYVTDLLRLGLHVAEDTSDRSFRTLQSGQEVEILQRNRNYAQVRLPDGTQGYVKVAYLVFEKPAKLIVQESQAEAARLQQELDDTVASFAAPAQTISNLEADVLNLRNALDEANGQVTELEASKARLENRQEAYKYSLPYSWVAGAILVCLLGGFFAGLWWVDHRSRARHGGIRIY